MKKVLLTKNFLLLCLLLLVTQTSWAGNHNGNTVTYYVNGHVEGNPWTSTYLFNSSGDEVRTIGNDYYENQIAISGSFNAGDWVYRNDNSHVDWRANANTQTLSVLNLSQGDKVKLYFWGQKTDGTLIKPTIKSSNTNVDKGQTISTGQEITMTSAGTMDFSIVTSMFITQIDVIYTNTSNRATFDTSGMESGGYFRCRLSSRSFNEPNLSVYPSNTAVTYTVETYDKMNGTKLNDQYHEVAILNTQQYKSGDLLFKNLGWCKVTARTSQGAEASYWVEVWDNEVEGELQSDGITYKLVKVKDADGNLLPDAQQGGVLKERTVTAVGGITMTFGIPDDDSEPNTTVAYLRDGHMVSYTSANNGWWDRYPHNNYSWPTQGTFYRFEASAKGKLHFGGIKDLTGGKTGKVYLVRISDGFPQTEVFTYNQSGYLTTSDNGTDNVKNGIDMEPGYIYYLQGEANEEGADNWSAFLLEWFSYETDMKLSAEWGISAQTGYEIGNGGTVTSRETVTGASGATCTVACKGNIQSATAAIQNGHIVFSNIQFKTSEKDKMGGAMKVEIKVGTSSIYYYMTIPYGQHVWDFRRTADQSTEHGDFSYDEAGLINMMKGNTTNWTRVYKVHRIENGQWIELVSPIMAARGDVNGDNAFYMDNTAGLAFKTSDLASFGAGETSNSAEGFSSMTQDEQYYLSYETTSGGDLVWMKGNSTIYFPGVKAGQYIKVYTYRHSFDKGETFTAKNLTDLDGNVYNPEYTFRLRGIWEARYNGYVGDMMKGAAIFRVTSDATNNIDEVPSLTLCDDGWVHIYKIEICDEYKPDLFFTTDAGNGNVYVDEDGINGSIVVRNGQAVEKEYLSISGNTGCQNANTCDYEVIADEGVNIDVNRETWTSPGGVNYNNLKLKYKGGNGLVKIIQRERANTAGSNVTNEDPAVNSGNFDFGYVIDKREYNIAVGELTEQTYPYTWDFNSYNMYQGDSETDTDLAASATANAGNWSSEEGTFTQINTSTYKMGDNTSRNPEQEYTVIKPLFAQGAQLVAGNKTIIESEGLGIQLPYTAQDKDFTWPTSSGAPSGQVVVGHRAYKGYDMTKKFVIDGNQLSGCGQITIPSVDNGMYVFVKASAAPTVKIGGNDAQAVSKFDVADGVYLYQNTGSKADVVLSFASEVSIDKIGVTNIDKRINKLGYATESRDHAIDHTYTGIFTSNDVNAFGIEAYGEGETVYEYKGYATVQKSAKEVTVVPDNTGVVLYKDGNEAEFHAPLFYPACNVVPTDDDLATLETNCMAPNVESTLHTSETETIDNKEYTKFIMTTKYMVFDGKTQENGEQQESTVEAFYRMKIDTNASTAEKNNTIGANKAYLLVPTDKLPVALWNGGDGKGNPGSTNTFYIDLKDVDGDIADGIEAIFAEENTKNLEQKVFYTIDGRRINGQPKAKGIYICDGKKISIK